MGRDRAKNFLRRAKRLNVQDSSQLFRDQLDSGDRDDLLRLNFTNRSRLTAALDGLQRGANIDLEIYTPKKPRTYAKALNIRGGPAQFHGQGR